MKNIIYGTLLSILLILTGCGPGGTNTSDTTPPAITLKGANPMTLTVGDTYNEPRATATDEKDGNVDVTISGSVDTNEAGTYTIAYTAEDKAGNKATKTRTVTVKEAPDQREYGKLGTYKVEDPYPYNNSVIYYTKQRENMPIVLFLTGWGQNIQQYDKLLRFIASHGYYTIAIKEEGSDSNYDKYADNFKKIIEDSEPHHSLDTSKIGFLGHSSGGGYGFYIMDQIKKNYNTKSDFVISLDGWFPFGMDDDALGELNTTTLFLQFGGADGVYPYGDNHKYMQDPRINLYIYHKLPGDNKAFSFIDAKVNDKESHGYLYDNGMDLNEYVSDRQDLLKPIHAMLNYVFEGAGQDARNIALESKIDKVIIHKDNDYYEYGCNDRGYDYCDTE